MALRTDFDLLDEVWPERPGLPAAPVYEHLRAACAAAARRQAGAGARSDGARRRHAPLHLDRRRHRLAAQPARRRRQLQPGVPGPRAARTRAARRCSSPTARSTPRCRPRWPPTACASRPMTQAAAALAALPADAVLLIDPRRVTLGLRAHAHACTVVEAINPSTCSRAARAPPRPRTCARRWRRTARRCASSTPGSKHALARGETHHRTDHRRALSAARAQPARLRGPELRHHRRLQRQRRDAALPRHAGIARRRSTATACC